MQNLHRRFDCYYKGQIYSEDLAKMCGRLRIYEFYLLKVVYLTEAMYSHSFVFKVKPQVDTPLSSSNKLLFLFKMCYVSVPTLQYIR